MRCSSTGLTAGADSSVRLFQRGGGLQPQLFHRCSATSVSRFGQWVPALARLHAHQRRCSFLRSRVVREASLPCCTTPSGVAPPSPLALSRARRGGLPGGPIPAGLAGGASTRRTARLPTGPSPLFMFERFQPQSPTQPRSPRSGTASAISRCDGAMRRVASPEVLGRSVEDDELQGEHDPSEFEAGATPSFLKIDRR